jgi:hypothetical protein
VSIVPLAELSTLHFDARCIYSIDLDALACSGSRLIGCAGVVENPITSGANICIDNYFSER